MAYETQKQSQGMAESINIKLHDLRKWFTDRPDELVILPDNPHFTSYVVSKDRTLVLFASRGMFDTLVNFVGDRAHIVVDTKMKILQKQRGIATVYIQVKDRLRSTSWHVCGRRVQGCIRPAVGALMNKHFRTFWAHWKNKSERIRAQRPWNSLETASKVSRSMSFQ